MEPLEEIFEAEFPDYEPFPFGAKREIQQLVRHILLAEPLLAEFGELFQGMSEEEIDRMMRSFRFENCVRRARLAKVLADHARPAAPTATE
jgi:endoglucanase